MQLSCNAAASENLPEKPDPNVQSKAGTTLIFYHIIYQKSYIYTSYIYLWNPNVIHIAPVKNAENPDPRTTDDHFLMEIPIQDNEKQLKALLAKTGAVELHVVEKDAH